MTCAPQFRACFSALLMLTAILGIAVSHAQAQPEIVAAQMSRGFERTAPATVLISEMTRQPDLWMMEVQYKPVRLVWIEVPNATGEGTTREQVWYLVWRAAVRPLATPDEKDLLAVNELDPLPGPRQFVPQLTLVTYDDPKTEIPVQILKDEILPGALAQIRQIERNQYKDMVSVVQNVPEAQPADAEDQNWIYGVTTWRGVDAKTDFFKVIFAGFTNGYEVRKEVADTPQVWRKVFTQRFYRPGDQFDPLNREFQYSGQPEWSFQPDVSQPAAE